MFPKLLKQRNDTPKTTSFHEGLDHEVIDKQRGVMNVFEDSFCIVKTP